MEENRKLEERVRTLEAQLAQLLEGFEALADRHENLRDRLLTLSIATQPHPRFPFFTWYITRDISDENRAQLQFVLGRLSERIDGVPPMSEFRLTKIPGIPEQVLYGDGPPSIEEINTAVKWVTGMKHDVLVHEMFQALYGQGMHQSLCHFYLGDEPDVALASDIDINAATLSDSESKAVLVANASAHSEDQSQWSLDHAEIKRELSTLREAIRSLSLGKATRPEFAFDDWLVKNNVFKERRLYLELVLSALEERLAGRAFTVRRSVPGIVDDWLYKRETPTFDEARTLLMLALDTKDAGTIDELFQALAAQGDRHELIAWWTEASTRAPGAPRSPRSPDEPLR